VYLAIFSVEVGSPVYQSDVEHVPTSLHGAVYSLGSFCQRAPSEPLNLTRKGLVLRHLLSIGTPEGKRFIVTTIVCVVYRRKQRWLIYQVLRDHVQDIALM